MTHQNPGKPCFTGVFAVLLLLFLTAGLVSCAGTRQKSLEKPQARVDRDLNYPLSAQLAHVEGDVLVGVFVNEAGEAEEINVVRSSGNRELDSAAVEFAGLIGYQPATLQSKPFGAWTHLELRYKLTEKGFDDKEWLDDVRSLQRKLANETDVYARNIYQQRLFLKYTGFSAWAAQKEYHNILQLLRQTVHRQVWADWQDVLREFPSPFILFLDFDRTFSDCEFTAEVRQALLEHIISLKARINTEVSKSDKNRHRFQPFLQRLNALQQSFMQTM